ncbi:MAG: DUF3696 domain-containing protein [Cyanobacteria bacterium P01_G01_bin.38]
MLTQLRFQNFKSWQDTGDIRFAPLTGLFGTNSSGKTAILQFLLMLKQTIESNDQKAVLHTGNERTYVDLGTTKDLIHNHTFPNKLIFSVEWLPTGPSFDLSLPVGATPFPIQKPDSFKVPVLAQYQEALHFKCKISLDINELKVQEFEYIYTSRERNEVRFGLSLDSVESKSNVYELIAEGYPLDEIRMSNSYKIDPLKIHDFSGALNIKFHHGEFLRNLPLAFGKMLEGCYYLGPLRDYPKRIYPWSGEQPQDVGRKGELTIPALLSGQKESTEIEKKVAYWLKNLGLINDFSVRPIAEGRREFEVRVRRKSSSTEVSVTDVGFGVSQILPVLVLCYYVPEGSTILLEQPEIHLHPSVQAGLADVFIDVIKNRDVQIILESHSEHLLRRLQRRIAEGKLDFTHEDAALYFCQMDEAGNSSLKPLELDTFGNISNWPEDFFGDEMGDLVAMTEAAMQRQMVSEAN